MTETPRTALLVIDVQNDFCAGGALEVRGGDRVVPPLNTMIARAAARHDPVYATRDWHPPGTHHFKAYGGTWPVHCVAGSPGAQFHPDLKLSEQATIITKGDTHNDEGYSAFEGHTADGRSLADELSRQRIQRLIVGGLTTDYCVRHSVLDALREGFGVVLLTDAVAAVNLDPADGERALEEMTRAGAELRTTADIAGA
jgi:nicotinamidase/pyrazinamidase